MPVVGCDAQSFTPLELLHKGIVALAVHLKVKQSVLDVTSTAEIAERGTKLSGAILPTRSVSCSSGCMRTEPMHAVHHRVGAAQIDEVAAMGDDVPCSIEAKLLSHLAELGSALWVQGLGLPLPLAARVQCKGIAPCRQAVRSGSTPCRQCQVNHLMSVSAAAAIAQGSRCHAMLPDRQLTNCSSIDHCPLDAATHGDMTAHLQ